MGSGLRRVPAHASHENPFRLTPFDPPATINRRQDFAMDRSDTPIPPRNEAHDRIDSLTRTVRTKTGVCNRGDGCDGCWLWLGSLDSSGYSKFKLRGKTVILHRYVWEHFNGPIPDGLTVDHLCSHHRNCINPDHMELVTRTENSIRANERRYGKKRNDFYIDRLELGPPPRRKPQPKGQR